jgi:hypothetical protein
MRAIGISLLALFGSVPAIAGDTQVTAAGQALAEQWCAECHLVVAEQPYAWSGDAPTFFEVADDPSVTEAGLRAFLANTPRDDAQHRARSPADRRYHRLHPELA